MKKSAQPQTMQQIADVRGWDVKTVRKWRQKLGLGTPFGRTYLMTEADADEIAKHIRAKAGCPLFGETIKGTPESAALARSHRKSKVKQ